MAYTGLLLENLAELKSRVGNTSDSILASILGLNYPTADGYVTYRWFNTSIAIADDFEVVTPTARIGLAGRWIRVDNAQLPQSNSDWNATTGVTQILNKPTTLSGYGITDAYTKTDSNVRFLTGFTESDPTVPSFVKAITTTDLSHWSAAYGWGDHNAYGYLTENSFSLLINKSGNISQWTNNVGYITGVTSSAITASLGYTPYNSTNPAGFITSSALTWTNISGKPTLFDGDYNSLINKPILFSGAYSDLTGKPTLFSGSYNDLNDKPALFDGNYNSLSNKPSIPAAQVNVDWSATSGVTQILNKPTLFSGSYSDLTNKPSIPAAQVNADWSATTGVAQILNRPALFSGIYADLTGKPILFSGAYADLTGKPTIPTNTNQLTNGANFITGVTSSQITSALGFIPYNTSNPAGYISSVPAQSFTSLTGKPTTLVGYGITDAYPLTGNPSAFLTGVTSSQISTALGFTPYSASNPAGYISSVPAQSFASLTGKPTTLTGYGITDAYPLVGNPSSFLTGITSTQVTNALGFTPLTTAGARAAISLTTNTDTGATYNSSTGVLNVPAYYNNKVFNNNVSRTLNSNYTISTTRDALVNYSVSLSVTNPLLTGTSTASAFLEYSTDGGTNWITVSQVSNASSVALSVTIAITLPNTAILSGYVPANALVRLRTTIAGTATATYTRGQEVLV